MGVGDIPALAGLLAATVLVVFVLPTVLIKGLRSAYSAMGKWPWWWPKSQRHYR
ncbi:MAG: hypothetical protein RLZZ342_661 [Candidatus Parcubacteria bacterium]|jgi:hypothetical protein